MVPCLGLLFFPFEGGYDGNEKVGDGNIDPRDDDDDSYIRITIKVKKMLLCVQGEKVASYCDPFR